MKKRGNSRTTALLFAAAIVLMLGGTVGSTRAALTYYSDTYTSRMQTSDIGVALLENGKEVSKHRARDNGDKASGALLQNLLGRGETLQLGRAYPEELAVRNSGSIDQYLRVSIYRYWVGDGEEKVTSLSPDLIDLRLENLGSAWILDEEASTPERTVLYYTSPVGSGETTRPFSSTLAIKGDVAKQVTQTTTRKNNSTVISTVYDYNGVEFRLEVQVNAVQTHNAESAIWSAWGRRVSVSQDGALRLS